MILGTSDEIRFAPQGVPPAVVSEEAGGGLARVASHHWRSMGPGRRSGSLEGRGTTPRRHPYSTSLPFTTSRHLHSMARGTPFLLPLPSHSIAPRGQTLTSRRRLAATPLPFPTPTDMERREDERSPSRWPCVPSHRLPVRSDQSSLREEGARGGGSQPMQTGRARRSITRATSTEHEHKHNQLALPPTDLTRSHNLAKANRSQGT